MAAAIFQHQDSCKNSLYEQIVQHTNDDINDQYLAVILSSWINKEGALPQYLGLSLIDFRNLMQSHFPGFRVSESIRKGEVVDAERMPEMEDLLKLFHTYRGNNSRSEVWIAQIITVACLGDNHLWQDLGLWNREQLSSLISANFPSLSALNNKNMKWKKFLYKQLCNEEGIYTCRSPSCEVCTDYAVCFGPEE